MLAGILQSDFESLMVKQSVLKFFSLMPPPKSLKEDVKEKAGSDSAVLSVLVHWGEKTESRSLRTTQTSPKASLPFTP